MFSFCMFNGGKLDIETICVLLILDTDLLCRWFLILHGVSTFELLWMLDVVWQVLEPICCHGTF